MLRKSASPPIKAWALTLTCLSLLALPACGPSNPGARPCGELVPRNDQEISYCNGLGEDIIALWRLPTTPPPEAGYPAVIVLHGSGGLFEETRKPGVCREAPEQQFDRWSERLNAAGYAMLAPASFYSRGFCEDRRRQPVPEGYDGPERLVTRAFDLHGAADWLCEREDIDCSKIAVLGFSNGGSTTLLSVYDALGTPTQSSGSNADPDPRLAELAGPTPFVGAVAYYPGCTLHDQIDDSLASEDLSAFYFPAVPTLVHHGSRDRLHTACKDIRLPQTKALASERGRANPFTLRVFGSAAHGFDNADGNDGSDADRQARDAAVDLTMDALARWFE